MGGASYDGIHDPRRESLRRVEERGHLRLHGLGAIETGPLPSRQQADTDEDQLAGDEEHQPLEGGVHETVAVKSNAQHVDAEPGKNRRHHRVFLPETQPPHLDYAR